MKEKKKDRLSIRLPEMLMLMIEKEAHSTNNKNKSECVVSILREYFKKKYL